MFWLENNNCSVIVFVLCNPVCFKMFFSCLFFTIMWLLLTSVLRMYVLHFSNKDYMHIFWLSSGGAIITLCTIVADIKLGLLKLFNNVIQVRVFLVHTSSKIFDIWDKRLWDMVDFNHKPKTPLSPMSTRWLILTTTPFSQPYKVG